MISAQAAAGLISIGVKALEALVKIVKVVKDGLEGKRTPDAVKTSIAKLVSDIAKTDEDIDAKLRAKFGGK